MKQSGMQSKTAVIYKSHYGTTRQYAEWIAEALKSRKLIVFSVGAAYNNDETLKAVTEANLDGEMQQDIRHFHLRGGLNYSSMQPLHRLMTFLLKKKLEQIPAAERPADARGIIETYGKDINFLKRDSIQPLIDYAVHR
ncbi:MAG: hypothetical protein ACOCVC_03960 [Spirochaeta sp.]